jgi:serine/threonine protein kinase
VPDESPSKDDYLKVIPNISNMLDDDDPVNDFPISNEMHSHDRYQEGRLLGTGAMKEVNLAKDFFTDRDVALAKLIEKDNADKTESFFLEARLTARLQHPNIVPIYDAGFNDAGEAFFTMKPVGGKTLQNYIAIQKNTKKSNFQNRLEIFGKIADAMAYAHSNKVIHLDLKPENIYLGEFGEVLVGDWGLAKVPHVSPREVDLYNSKAKGLHTLHGYIKGTPGYMSPEQIDKSLGGSDEQSDIYALGIILFELLCLESANEGKDLEGILKNTILGELKRPDVVCPTLPEGLESIIMKSIEVDKSQRYQTVGEIISDLKKFQGGFITSAERNSFLKSFTYLLKRHRLVSSLLTILVLGSFFFIVEIYREKERVEIQRNEALAQKKIANQQANEALAQKKIADDARQYSEEISKTASPRFVKVAADDLMNYRFASALTNVNLATSLDPLNKEAKQLKARLLFIMQRFQEATEIFDELPRRFHRQKHAVILRKYTALKKDDSSFLDPSQLKEWLADSFSLFTASKPPRRTLLYMTNYAYLQSAYSLPEKIEIAEWALIQTNVRLGTDWQMKAEVVGGRVNIDLSGQEIITLEALKFLPLYELDISYTNLKELHSLRESSVTVLKLKGMRIPPQEFKKLNNLKEVHISLNYLDGKSIKGIKIVK